MSAHSFTMNYRSSSHWLQYIYDVSTGTETAEVIMWARPSSTGTVWSRFYHRKFKGKAMVQAHKEVDALIETYGLHLEA